MQFRRVAVPFIAALVCSASAAARQGEFSARAEIAGDGITGHVELREFGTQRGGAVDPDYATATRGVELVITVTGLTPGPHGMHLHAVGRCEAPFTSAGGHFDPGPAGNTDPDANHPFHMGDLPNLVADASGRVQATVVTTRVTLGDGPVSLFDADGTALIVHGNPDRGVTGESRSGVSGGPRVACGVIERQ